MNEDFFMPKFYSVIWIQSGIPRILNFVSAIILGFLLINRTKIIFIKIPNLHPLGSLHLLHLVKSFLILQVSLIEDAVLVQVLDFRQSFLDSEKSYDPFSEYQAIQKGHDRVQAPALA